MNLDLWRPGPRRRRGRAADSTPRSLIRAGVVAVALVSTACTGSGGSSGDETGSSRTETADITTDQTTTTSTTTTTTTTTVAPKPTLPTPILVGHDFGYAVSESVLDDPARAAIVESTASVVTAENDMKMDRIHPARGVYDFEAADRIVRAAQAADQTVRGHTLIWHNQLPSFVIDAEWDREGLLEVMENHINRVVRHFAEIYPGVVVQWDVVNEAFTSTGERRESIWQDVIGDDYIEMAFRFAREADPDALLFYNDFYAAGIVGDDDAELAIRGASSTRSDCEDIAKCAAVRDLAAAFVDDGVPIDGIGFQGHILDLDAPDYQQLAEWTGPLGLQWALTEIDVALASIEPTTPELLERQADVYGALVSDCVRASNCNTTVVWGVTDDRSWIMGKTDGRLDRPLLYDGDARPKPALARVRESLAT